MSHFHVNVTRGDSMALPRLDGWEEFFLTEVTNVCSPLSVGLLVIRAVEALIPSRVSIRYHVAECSYSSVTLRS